ncbi:sugar phosphate isomerase/epimerase|uniref:Sugar phosphate isomerase/epimerase n=1 Tax=Dendrosporobacter quercicolus TaxID=146817 RepID=A0A1G9S2P3_9FIRM|nr:sugar phosphate isomerase/epimerase family protein [Dendrosporobacter quercicolus]NSL49482.1 sugar phosphate isomerase/epimerase [Dendrosporobacter quercicolus DSM 1736]SDM29838.1 Sugar phosphate isomerase/epimerase [Dendrosporobacter quercicolus]
MAKVSIFSWFGFPIPMDKRFKMIKAAGFDGVLLWWSDEHAAVDGDKAVQPALARENGLCVENIHAPFEGINCLWTDGRQGDEFEQVLANCINESAVHEIPTVVMHLSAGEHLQKTNQTGLDRIKRLVELAERKNVNIALENLRRLEYLHFILDNIQSDRLGFCYDSGHEYCYNREADLLTQYGARLMAVHIHDNDGVHDLHKVPGEGSVDWKAVVAKLKKSVYRGAVALEVTNKFSKYGDTETPEWFLRRAFQSAKKLYEFLYGDSLSPSKR